MTPAQELPTPPEGVENGVADEGSLTGDHVTDKRVAEVWREAWGQALIAVNTAEEEVQRFLGRVGGWIEMKPDEARKLGTDLAERLRQQRDELERSVEVAVQRALTPFRSGRREELSQLAERLSSLEERLDRLLEKRQTRR